ncbi:hypothetical protein BOTNAR_0085g00250 [Botryotinia narcissicola]|uniref:Uncharacterized protein n=1 Tax=Botryotinia narcissicola TaxID=278944 RepID=A0A4Z1ITF7_9HELO|nr:hypothetical protein BOTNAR_0085g00250 [Botryotinia narcissicola]
MTSNVTYGSSNMAPNSALQSEMGNLRVFITVGDRGYAWRWSDVGADAGLGTPDGFQKKGRVGHA